MTLNEKLSLLPTDPGVYLMKNQSGAIIYVGKAKILKNRVKSYFIGKEQTPKTRALVSEITDFELILCKNEVEALLLERTLIRHHKPHYNILLRDDKEYPWVRIDFNAKWPRIEKVRRQKDDGATYLGPFGNEGMLTEMLRTIFKIFPLCRCSSYTFKTAKRPCNYYHMKMCLAPCYFEVDREVYVGIVRDAMAVLQGKSVEIKASLTEMMQQAARAEQFEIAAHYRDQLNALKVFAERQVAVVNDVAQADVIGFAKNSSHIVFHVLLIRDKRIIGGENFLSTLGADDDEEQLISFILQYYAHRSVPELLVTQLVLTEPAALIEVLAHSGEKKLQIRMAGRGESKQLMALALKNAEHHLEQTHLSSQRTKVGLEMIQEALLLTRPPERIECIDISNLGESAVVASDVCFMGGNPAKELYRHYNIKTLAGRQDDFASIREVVQRRLERAALEGDLPDLLVIDGGKGQLSAAMEAKAQFPALDFALISLAKSRTEHDAISEQVTKSSERIFLPDQDEPILLAEDSPVYRLIVRIRDEAHRFAIGFHRKQRSKRFTSSLLDDVPGIGTVLKKRLLEHFGGLEAIKLASVDQLLEVKGMNEKIAIRLYALIHGEVTQEEPSQV